MGQQLKCKCGGLSSRVTSFNPRVVNSRTCWTIHFAGKGLAWKRYKVYFRRPWCFPRLCIWECIQWLALTWWLSARQKWALWRGLVMKIPFWDTCFRIKHQDQVKFVSGSHLAERLFSICGSILIYARWFYFTDVAENLNSSITLTELNEMQPN